MGFRLRNKFHSAFATLLLLLNANIELRLVFVKKYNKIPERV